MLIKPDIKKDMSFAKYISKISCICIGLEKLQCMANMWLCVGIRKSGSDIEFFAENFGVLFFYGESGYFILIL